MNIPHFNRRILLSALLMVGLSMFGCDKSNKAEDSQQLTGVISTGNAGRIQGRTVSDNQGIQVSVRLVKLKLGGDSLVDSIRTDTGGTFAFNKVPYGGYRVEAWREGKLQGQSGTFQVDKDLVKDILIVLVQPVRYFLDVSSIGSVDSMFLNYPGNAAYKHGSLWSVQGLKGDSGIIYTRVTNSAGTSTWLSWEVRPSGDSLRIIGVGTTPNAPFIKQIDTSAFFLTPHTTALWTFDAVSSSGIVRDLSGHGCDLVLPSGATLQNSPHGKALVAKSLKANAPASTSGVGVPSSLIWARTGMQTLEMRIKIDSHDLGGYLLMGSYVGPQIGLSANGAIGVYQQIVSPTSDAAMWYGTISEPNTVPIGKWIDISVSIDKARNDFYLWIDGQPVPMYPISDVQVGGLVADSTYPFQVGGGSEDSRVGPFQVEEVRISDTLVFGQGIRTRPSLSSTTTLTISGNSSSGSCTSCGALPIGGQPASSEGFILVNPSIPASAVDRRVVTSLITLWATTPPPQSKRFVAHRLLKSVSELSQKPTNPVAGIDYESAPLAYGTLQATSSGGIILEVSVAVQEWIDHPDQAKGLLIKAVDPASTLIQVRTANSSPGTPTIKIQYH